MTKLADLKGEVVTIAVDPSRGRFVACTSFGDAAEFGPGGPDEALTSLGRSTLEGLGVAPAPDIRATLARGEFRSYMLGTPIDVRAAFVGGRLYLRVEGFARVDDVSTLVAIDPETETIDSVFADPESTYAGRVTAPIGVDDRFVVLETFDVGGSSLVVHDIRGMEHPEPISLAYTNEDGRNVTPGLIAMDFDPVRRRLYLATLDPDNHDGNRVLALTLDPECRPLGPLEKLLRVKEVPYSPDIGGLCANPHDGEVACLMYASEREGVIPIDRMPRNGDPLPVAELRLVRPGAEPRRLAVHGYLETNLTFLNRENEVCLLPHRFRYRFDFDGAKTEVTPVLALGPDRYLATLFHGTLLDFRANDGSQSVVAQFEPSITALSAGLTPDKTLVGLADGSLHQVEVPSGS